MPRAASHRHEPPPPAPQIGSRSQPEHRVQYIFDRHSVREVDRLAIEEYAIPGVVLMENAARGLERAALEMLAGAFAAQRKPCVGIVCGTGNNGGDGYALARLLHNAGCHVTIHPLGSPRGGTDAASNRTICERMKLAMQPLSGPEQLRGNDLIVDAILGTGLDKPVQGDAAHAIEWINQANRPVLAVDVPSGMDCDTGSPLGACVKATHTVTFVGLKKGYESLDAQKLLGEVTVADIGAPIELVKRLALKRSPPQTPGRG
jgi:hydroxyethylthiazole kinase-like uncharacterized protein yjeF